MGRAVCFPLGFNVGYEELAHYHSPVNNRHDLITLRSALNIPFSRGNLLKLPLLWNSRALDTFYLTIQAGYARDVRPLHVLILLMMDVNYHFSYNTFCLFNL